MNEETKGKEISERLFELSEKIILGEADERKLKSFEEELKSMNEELTQIHKSLIVKTESDKYDPMAPESTALENKIKNIEDDKEIIIGLLANIEQKRTENEPNPENGFFQTVQEENQAEENVSQEEIESEELEETIQEDESLQEDEPDVIIEEEEELEPDEIKEETEILEEYEEEIEKVSVTGEEQQEPEEVKANDEKVEVEQESLQIDSVSVPNIEFDQKPTEQYKREAIAVIAGRERNIHTLAEAIYKGEKLSRQLMEKLQPIEEHHINYSIEKDYKDYERTK